MGVRVTDDPPEPAKPGRLRRLARHIHGPDLLVEIIAVVLGILIALAVDQAVDNWRQRQDAAAARDAIRKELAEDLGFLAARARSQSCIDARFAELERILDQGQDGTDAPTPLWVGRPPTWPVSSAQWDAAVGSGRASLLPSSESGQYASVYYILRLMNDEQQREQHVWAQLRTLEGLRKAPPESIQALRVSLAEARYADFRFKLSHVRAIATAASAGIRPGPGGLFGPRAKVQSICVPLATSRADALRIIQSPYGEP